MTQALSRMQPDHAAGSSPVRVAYVARNDGTDTRISKECNSLLAAGYHVTLIGWDRSPGASRSDPMPAVLKRLFVRRAGFGPGGVAAGAAGFLRHAAKQLWLLRPHVVHCANEDLALFALALRPLLRYTVVCDIFDSIALRWSASGAARAGLARSAAGFAQRFSDAVLVTDEARRARLLTRPAAAAVVPNYPVDAGAALALCVPALNDPVRLYVSGSLTAGRGLNGLLALLEQRPDVQVVCAGWPLDEVSRGFVQHERVEYHGVVSPRESLRLAASCHAVVALYAPANDNNLLASPNKVYDALCVGRPLIINREAIISRWVADVGAGHLVPYGDAAALATVVDRLIASRAAAAGEARRLRGIFEAGYSWSVAEEALLATYRVIAPPPRS
jgi:glycosyltransferase involved in cell wall biosynthesis